MIHELQRIERRVRWLRGWAGFFRLIALLWLVISALVIVVGVSTINDINTGNSLSGTSFTQSEIQAIAEATTVASFIISGAAALSIFFSLMIVGNIHIDCRPPLCTGGDGAYAGQG